MVTGLDLEIENKPFYEHYKRKKKKQRLIVGEMAYSLFGLCRKLQNGLDRAEEAEARLLKKLNSWIYNFPDEYVVLRSIKVYESSKKAYKELFIPNPESCNSSLGDLETKFLYKEFQAS
ncbi:hypothetical protein LWI28_013306 [Acer negundo]|uniref:Uncharacterized protein n=1 Tax=Acer negundo TaxID=4023 RepID=A0AAD5IA23_ACENE|nr:hypothetical protein LWI28_013306 [Acer negundo]